MLFFKKKQCWWYINLKKLRIIGLIFLLLIGLITIGLITGILSIPSVKSYNNRWGAISNNTTEIITNINIENSNPFKIIVPRVKVDYRLKMNTIEMAHGTIEDIYLEKGESTIEVTSYFDNTKIPEWWVSHIKNNETTIVDIEPEVVIDVEFSKPGIKTQDKTIPLETNLLKDIDNINDKTIEAGSISLNFKPYSCNWGNISNETTEIIMEVIVTNPIDLSVSLPEINYTITMNNITIGKGKTMDLIVLKANNKSTITIITKIKNNLLDDWFVSHLLNNEHTTIEISINTTIRYKDISYKSNDFVIYNHDFDTNILGAKL